MSAIRPNQMFPAAALAACSLLMAACGSGSSAPVSTHPAGEPYLSRIGTGSATLPSIALPARSTLVWHFSCTNPSSRRSFVLTSTPDGGKATTVTNQTGLEGGGYRPLKTAGVFTFAVKTTCSWQVLLTTEGIDTIPTTVPKARTSTSTTKAR